jgi:cytosine/uracil/thiamine/allantoin permease
MLQIFAVWQSKSLCTIAFQIQDTVALLGLQDGTYLGILLFWCTFCEGQFGVGVVRPSGSNSGEEISISFPVSMNIL